MTAEIAQLMARKEQPATAHPARHTGLRAAVDNLSLRLADAGTVELLTEALHRLVTLAYERDDAGWVNVDPVTRRLLIPAPWGRAGRARWGLYPLEADTLRAMLKTRMRGRAAPLFAYDKLRRAWLVELGHYPAEAEARAYLDAQPLTVEEFRQHRRKVRGR